MTTIAAMTDVTGPTSTHAGGADSRPILRVNDLRVTFSRMGTQVHAVNGLTYDVRAGRTLAIIGESGSGKSVSVRALMGLLPPSAFVSGSATLADGDRGTTELIGMNEKAMRRIRGKDIAMVFQDPARSLNPTMSVGAQIGEAIRMHFRIDRAEVADRAIELLKLVRLPAAERRYHEYPHQLSGGMRQRVMIAIALAADPNVLIADEATTALDVTTQAQIMELLADLQERLGTAVVMISHDLGLAANYADEVMVMYAGKVVEHAETHTLFRNVRMPYTKALLSAIPQLNVAPHTPLTIIGGHRDDKGGAIVTAATQTEPLLSVRNVVQDFVSRGPGGVKSGVVHAVSDVSLELATGEALGIVGETGSGKTTLARSIIQLERPRTGEVLFEGQNMVGMSKRQLKKARANMQMIYQDPFGSLNPRWRIEDVVAEPLLGHTRMNRPERRARVRELLDMVGLNADTYLRRRPMELSGGQAQRVAIARAIALNPKVIICDEAVSSLDVLIQAQIINLFEKLRVELGLSYVFIAHNLATVKQVSDRVAVMNLGQLVEIGPSEDLYRAPLHPYTRVLLDSIPGLDPETGVAHRPVAVQGEPPSPLNPPSGCRFRTRCPLAQAVCAEVRPILTEHRDGHLVACHFPLDDPETHNHEEHA